MSYEIEYLKYNSKLPGSRANLELLYDFTKNATDSEIDECLSIGQIHINSPEEFILTCGVAGCIYSSLKQGKEISISLNDFANHSSWRVREAICIGFQKSKSIVEPLKMLSCLETLKKGSPLELRTYIATICEPDLLTEYIDADEILSFLLDITLKYFNHNSKLNEELQVLKKALAYCWSVALCGQGADKRQFEKLVEHIESKHIKWIINENLKKKRLEKLDIEWVNHLKNHII